ncbi:MAG: leucyl aminopeptidase [Maritimibacter sp.]|nr:leucyl aminopeptidase [Maritimibacter sp.]
MTDIIAPRFVPLDIDQIASAEGRVAVLTEGGDRLNRAARRIDRLTRGALKRLIASEAFAALAPGEALELAWPGGMAAEAVQVVRIDRKMGADTARKAGGAIGAKALGKDVLVVAAALRHMPEIALGATLAAYAFRDHKTGKDGKDAAQPGTLTFALPNADTLNAQADDLAAVAAGVFFTRDLVNEPANVLTTEEFARRLEELSALGLKVSVLDEARMAELGMGALLGVGQGSESPSKLVVMEWQGGAEGSAPLALVGKGVVFDTGGISIKPAAGMEEMTMDMGGAGTVAGVMKTLALRKAPANVVGLVGLVENMPDGRAQRPGDIVRSMKGDTIEVINTDAEGRLVLADVLWYAQETFAPAGVIDLATLTGACVIALGHENAGVFSNDEEFAKDFLKAAATEGEGAWRLPLGPGYDKLLKSRLADMKNVGGRPAGATTAAQFLQRFVREGTPWIHLDIAGVALLSEATDLAPKGATGWFVRSLDRLVRENYEG